MEHVMKAMIYATAATITLVTANFAFAGNCATHSVEKVKCEMGNKTWDEATSTCGDPAA
jgi:hypothetical protein|tara:strand:+ start:127 stop:303 length:177 start_codon:yes stop_codon:yes gene_type:complete